MSLQEEQQDASREDHDRKSSTTDMDRIDSSSMLSMMTAAESTLSDISESPKEQLPLKSPLKVRSLSESLRTEGIKRSDSCSNKRVGFNTVEIREYRYILGCNPAVKLGLPLTIAWKSMYSTIQTVDDYEGSRPPRRSDLLLRMSSGEREQLLIEEGFTSDDFYTVEEDISSIRQSRELSKAERSELAALMKGSKRKQGEKIKKGIGRFFTFGKK